MKNITIQIWTDGSAKNNGKADSYGGWAYITKFPETPDVMIVGKGGARPATNQQMELTAAIMALEKIDWSEKPKVEIYSDSAYLVNCWKTFWWVSWLKNDWLNSKKQPVANRELWEKLIPHFENPDLIFIKVKGHSGDPMNEEVDREAQSAAEDYKP